MTKAAAALKPPEPPWRQIVEQMWELLAAWESDYAPEADHRCVINLHETLMAHEETWQDLSHWELTRR